MRHLTIVSIFLSLLLSGAIFGFFYAWICSTMWGLDAADPRIAIGAMQAMNASVRNAFFAPAFFATPLVLALTAFFLFRQMQRPAATAFAVASLVYLIGGLILTMAVNVPMNEALGRMAIPEDIEAARRIWQDYSPRWQLWNTIRTLASGLALMLGCYGLYLYERRHG